MRIEVLEALDGSRLDALAALEQQVVAQDGGRLKLSWRQLRTPAPKLKSGRTRTPVILAWEDDQLIGFTGVYTFGLPTVELAGMVAPDQRRRGVGSALLAAARQAAAEFKPKQVLLIAPRNGAGGAEFAAAQSGLLEHSEHAMALDGQPAVRSARGFQPPVALRAATTAELPTVSALLADGFGEEFSDVDADELNRPGSCTWLVYETPGNVGPDAMPIGTARTIRLDDTGSIYGFVIASSHRGRGIGRQVLIELCNTLREDGGIRVELEVATENDSALDLYESVGFKRVITEDYFALSQFSPTPASTSSGGSI